MKKIVELPVGVLEDRERLEQLRALENGMYIRAKLVNNLTLNNKAPADTDTPKIWKKPANGLNSGQEGSAFSVLIIRTLFFRRNKTARNSLIVLAVLYAKVYKI